MTTSSYEYADLFYPEIRGKHIRRILVERRVRRLRLYLYYANWRCSLSKERWDASELRDLIRQTGRSQPLWIRNMDRFSARGVDA